MSKKGYKKSKRVIFEYKKKKILRKRKLNFSAFFPIIASLFIISGLYYLNFWYVVNSTTPIYGKFLTEAIMSIHISASEYSGFTNSSYVPLSANWKKLLEKHPVTVAKQKRIVSSDQIIWHGSRDKKEVALTFDADMTPVMVDWLHDGQVSTYNDPRITDYLIQNQIKATFFLTGLWIESYPDVTRELADNPLFELENHSYSHPSMAGNCFDQPQIPKEQYPSEIEKVQSLLQKIAHVTPKYFRFPGGCYDQSDLNLVREEGLETVHWDDVADDGFNNNEQQIIHNVLSEARNGSIIVMHIGGAPNIPQTANALPEIIAGLKEKGYTFVTVSELLNPQDSAQKVSPKKYLSSLEMFKNVYPNSL